MATSTASVKSALSVERSAEHKSVFLRQNPRKRAKILIRFRPEDVIEGVSQCLCWDTDCRTESMLDAEP